MPNVPLDIPPGVNRVTTQHGVDGAWFDADKVRFRLGRPEPIGGWLQRTVNSLEGVPRRLRTWRALDDQVYTAAATNVRLYIIRSNQVFDITPFRSTSEDLQNPLTATATSATLTVEDAAHGARVGDTVVLSDFDGTAAGIASDVLNTTHAVTAVISTSQYTIELDTPATTSAAGFGGTSGDVGYEITAGGTNTQFALGWGAGPYGRGTYGTPRESSGVALRARVWSLDLWGQTLVGTYEDAPFPFMWDPTAQNVNTRAVVIPNAPAADLLFVSSPDRHLVLCSTTPAGGSGKDPLTVRWSDQEDFTTWAPAATNTAGDQRLSDGNRIVAATNGQSENLIWTDTSLVAMRFTGPPFIFGFNLRDANTAIASRNAPITVAGRTYWISDNNFYVYDGVVRPLPCPVLEYYADDVNKLQADKFFAALNREFNEIWWFYAPESSSEISLYVIYNYLEQHWSIGSLRRTCWESEGIRANPQAMDVDGSLYDHEVGFNADAVALEPFIETGELELSNGDVVQRVQRFIPDFDLTGELDVVLTTRQYPFAAPQVNGPYRVTPEMTKVDTRARGRSVTFRVQSSTLNTRWSLGSTRLELNPDGRR